MTWWAILLLFVGILWTGGGIVAGTLSVVFAGGLYGPLRPPEWDGWLFLALLVIPGPAMIVAAAVWGTT